MFVLTGAMYQDRHDHYATRSTLAECVAEAKRVFTRNPNQHLSIVGPSPRGDFREQVWSTIFQSAGWNK